MSFLFRKMLGKFIALSQAAGQVKMGSFFDPAIRIRDFRFRSPITWQNLGIHQSWIRIAPNKTIEIQDNRNDVTCPRLKNTWFRWLKNQATHMMPLCCFFPINHVSYWCHFIDVRAGHDQPWIALPRSEILFVASVGTAHLCAEGHHGRRRWRIGFMVFSHGCSEISNFQCGMNH